MVQESHDATLGDLVGRAALGAVLAAMLLLTLGLVAELLRRRHRARRVVALLDLTVPIGVRTVIVSVLALVSSFIGPRPAGAADSVRGWLREVSTSTTTGSRSRLRKRSQRTRPLRRRPDRPDRSSSSLRSPQCGPIQRLHRSRQRPPPSWLPRARAGRRVRSGRGPAELRRAPRRLPVVDHRGAARTSSRPRRQSMPGGARSTPPTVPQSVTTRT